MTSKISILAIDSAKGSFQVCAVAPDGAVVFNRAVSRTRLASLLADHPACILAMQACATSHHWGRFAQSHGHEVRLVPAAYVKPRVSRRLQLLSRMEHHEQDDEQVFPEVREERAVPHSALGYRPPAPKTIVQMDQRPIMH